MAAINSATEWVSVSVSIRSAAAARNAAAASARLGAIHRTLVRGSDKKGRPVAGETVVTHEFWRIIECWLVSRVKPFRVTQPNTRRHLTAQPPPHRERAQTPARARRVARRHARSREK
ncbi:hypothetical protein MARA_17140 [Mycolicibacterium arabiense]|uniref:Uncharacterized protein n=1 Tax=Mycolicibacterium arabiense TaxID=1286181 RepID=A0A7I7RW87_9MYCO|nr:hypothetical protein MARA_17140 [Mycolicibacterium arabiense]